MSDHNTPENGERHIKTGVGIVIATLIGFYLLGFLLGRGSVPLEALAVGGSDVVAFLGGGVVGYFLHEED